MVDRLGRPGIVIATVLLAVGVNLVIYLIGRAAGATYQFVSPQLGPSQVGVLPLVGFTAIPLALGMTVAALLVRRQRWAVPAGAAAAVLLSLGTIPLMTLAVGFDAASAAALSACHVALGVVAVFGLLALRGGRRT